MVADVSGDDGEPSVPRVPQRLSGGGRDVSWVSLWGGDVHPCEEGGAVERGEGVETGEGIGRVGTKETMNLRGVKKQFWGNVV